MTKKKATQSESTPVKSEFPVEATAAPAAAATSETHEPGEQESEVVREGYHRFLQRLLVEVREAGELGKKQWEEAFARTRQFLVESWPELRREELDRVSELVRRNTDQTLNTLRQKRQSWLQSDAFTVAQDRGADLLLRVVSRVRAGAESLEASLREVRARAERSEEPAESLEPAVAAAH